ncbi:hypothetical protein GCM10028803_56510 [Larkinella knui]|uniref:Glycosyltransferase family 1 protein n=1 Tax=Larkinella knui TaxID=2025310 RepID=A0A3P1CI76_9BACT|nr:glycosyltransferase [Larkinella knui]RRB12898.1 glycosyltransferase family 1 protein [Larkinella knui]
MKILWFTNTPSNASEEFNNKRHGGGWISSLESLFVKNTNHSLAICFFYNGNNFKKIEKNGVIYYGLPLNSNTKYKKAFYKYFIKLDDNRSLYIDAILESFKPDIIQVFGTEAGYGSLLKGKFDPDKVVFHLQGLVEPYSKVYFPSILTKRKVLLNDNLSSILKGNTYIHKYLLFKKRATRELEIVREWKHFIGRTEWDRNFVNLINPKSTYHQCEEVLRPFFYEPKNSWLFPNINLDKEIYIGTTINPNLYKGLDLVYKTIAKLKSFKIHWKIFGINENDPLNTIIKKSLPKTSYKYEITFFGQLAEDILVSQLKQCHFFVHPSYIDNSPNSVCEAMLLGMPVISSSVGGVKSLITHGENGFLFNPYDEYDLPGLINHLILNYQSVGNIAKNAKITALKRHDPTLILENLLNIYESRSKK